MRFKQALLCLSVCTALALAGLPEDSLSFPELLSPHYFEELEGTARFILQFRLRNDCACKSICHIDHGPFSFYLRSSEEQGTLRTSAGLSFASKHWQAGIGRGRPHIARGRILGNTMMGFSADPRNNYRIGRGNIRIRNYDYYPSLIYLGGEYGGVSLTAMLMSAVPVIISRLERKTFSTGLELFLTQPAILETWTEYRAAFWRGSADLSLTEKGLNHIGTDLFIPRGRLSFHAGGLYTAPSFRGFMTDAAWGTLQPASRGLCGGIAFSAGAWKIKGSGFRVEHSRELNQRFYLDLQYRQKSMEAGLGLQVKYGEHIADAENFPFSRCRAYRGDIIFKARLKFTVNPALQLDFQILTDCKTLRAGAGFLRLSYRKKGHLLRLQLTQGASAETILYLLRPLDGSSYAIQRMPAVETIYIDLVCVREWGPLRCSILINSSGLLFKLAMQT